MSERKRGWIWALGPELRTDFADEMSQILARSGQFGGFLEAPIGGQTETRY